MHGTLSKGSSVGRFLVFIAIAGCTHDAGAADDGWYVGAGFGSVDYGDRGVLYYGDLALDATNRDDSFDASSSISLAFGYRFNRYVSIESGYLSNSRSQWTLTDSAGQVFGTYEFRSEGASLAIVGTLPLAAWELYARLGLLYADTQARVVTDAGTLWSRSKSSPEAVSAIGAAYNFTEHWQTKLDFSFVPNAGEGNVTGQTDIEVLTLAFTYRF
jgi:hypothetical protein